MATGAALIQLSLVDLSEGARARLGERVRTGRRPIVLARWTAGRAGGGDALNLALNPQSALNLNV